MNRIITSVVIGLAGFQSVTSYAESRPKLVLGIVVDQLRTDYIEYLQEYFGSNGFRRLIDKGVFITDLDFKIPNADVANATAIIQTGAYPRVNGVTSETVYNPTSKFRLPVFHDPDFIGNFTSETYSPNALRVTTITDEIALDSEGKSMIHSISPDAEQSIVMAGHAAGSAFWINEETGKWSTTTYYTDAPAVLQNLNYSSPLMTRLDTLKWTPVFLPDSYPDVSSKRKAEGFRYSFPRSDRDVFELYKLSPMVNADVTDAAIEYLKELNFGKQENVTDVLNLGYTLAPYPYSPSDSRYETEDAYLRLDWDLSRLFEAVNKYVGLDKTLIYLTSTGYYNSPEIDGASLRLPGGNFSVKRALSLLNAYLTAKYGNGSYVDVFSNGHIYLDQGTIEEKGLDLSKIAEESRDFLVRMSGVSDAYTIADLMSPAVSQLEGHRLAADPKTGGDIILEFNPGWKVTDDSRYPPENMKQKAKGLKTPAFIMGPGIDPGKIDYTVDASAIAPTVARALRIRSPNGTDTKPIF